MYAVLGHFYCSPLFYFVHLAVTLVVTYSYELGDSHRNTIQDDPEIHSIAVRAWCVHKKPSLRKHEPLQTVLSSLIGCANDDDVAARLFIQDAKFRREIFLVLLCLHSRQWDGQDEGLSGYQNWETVSYRVCDEDPNRG